MAQLSRVRVALTGFQGAPGVMTFYCQNTAAFRDPIIVMTAGLTAHMPTSVNVQVEGGGDMLDSVTGEINGAWSFTPGGVTPGTSGGAFAAPAGVALNWITDTFLSGRRLRGRTYVVPLSGQSFGVDGTIEELVLTDLRAIASTFVTATANNLVVWQRPRKVSATLPARGGGYAPVVRAQVNDKVAILRSRRD